MAPGQLSDSRFVQREQRQRVRRRDGRSSAQRATLADGDQLAVKAGAAVPGGCITSGDRTRFVSASQLSIPSCTPGLERQDSPLPWQHTNKPWWRCWSAARAGRVVVTTGRMGAVGSGSLAGSGKKLRSTISFAVCRAVGCHDIRIQCNHRLNCIRAVPWNRRCRDSMQPYRAAGMALCPAVRARPSARLIASPSASAYDKSTDGGA